MKKAILLFILLVFPFALSGCGETAAAVESADGLRIVATVFPAYDFAREIAGEKGSVTLLVPPGAESHSFEPTAQDILSINSCDLLICNGGESEAWLEEIADGLDGNVRILSMLECVDALEEEIKEGMQSHEHEHGDGHEHEHEHDHDNEHDGEEIEYDEHVWTSPVNAALICKAIFHELFTLDGANAGYYSERIVAYCSQLNELDAEFREICENAEFSTLVFADRFPVRYFVEEYGLDYFAAFPGCADDAEPSARTVAFLIDRVRESGLPAVLYIEFSNQKMADVVCEDTGCKKLLFHSCHNVSADELKNGVSYLDLMRGNISTLKEALNGCRY